MAARRGVARTVLRPAAALWRRDIHHHRLRAGPSRSGSDGESHLDLQEIDEDLFVARNTNLWVPPGGRGVFGGQVVGQALLAATLTVPDDRVCHSLHSYFLLPGDPARDIVYRVHRSSDRRSFTSRSVQALQRGRIIFQADLSFAMAKETSPLHHQVPMPNVPPPESLPSHAEVLEHFVSKSLLPPHLVREARRISKVPVDMRFVNPPDLLRPRPAAREPTQQVWVRINQPLDDKPRAHRACAAYFSDHQLLVTALQPHGINFPSHRLGAVASLDHSMWFHKPAFRADEWMLYVMNSPWTGSGRGLAFGHLYEGRTGQLAVTCAQEGVLRLAKPSFRRFAAEGWMWANYLWHRCGDGAGRTPRVR